jgi:hypothetical protein
LKGSAFNALPSLKFLENITLQNALNGGNGGDLKWRGSFFHGSELNILVAYG